MRANVVCFAPNSGHIATTAPCLFSATAEVTVAAYLIKLLLPRAGNSRGKNRREKARHSVPAQVGGDLAWLCARRRDIQGSRRDGAALDRMIHFLGGVLILGGIRASLPK